MGVITASERLDKRQRPASNLHTLRLAVTCESADPGCIVALKHRPTGDPREV